MTIYTKEEVDEMRDMLAEDDLEFLGGRKGEVAIKKMLLTGFKGYKSFTDDEIIEAAKELWLQHKEN